MLVLAFAEIAASVYLFRWADEDAFIRYASWSQLQTRELAKMPKYSPHLYLGYYPTPNYSRGKNLHNSLGYRGEEIQIPKPEGEFRIACLGGSTTYTGKIGNYTRSYPYLLEEYLKQGGYGHVSVVNAGASNWSSWESLINFEFRVLDLEPDLIIVYHGINDVHPRLVWPPETYRGDNSGYRAHGQIKVFMPSVFEHSTLLRILMINAGWTTPHGDLERTTDRHPGTYYGGQFSSQKTRGVYPKGIYERVSALRMLEENEPIYFARNIENIVAIANHQKIEVVLSSFAYSPLFTDRPRVSSEEYVEALEEYNRLLDKISAELSVNFFDFASVFPDGRQYYVDGRHVTKKGVYLKAKLFGDYLIDNRLISDSLSAAIDDETKTGP